MGHEGSYARDAIVEEEIGDGATTAKSAAQTKGGKPAAATAATSKPATGAGTKPAPSANAAGAKPAPSASPASGAPEKPGDEAGTTGEVDKRTGRKSAGGAEAPEAAQEPPLRHILQKGQTLYFVSKMYGVKLEDLMRANGITDPHNVSAGRSLLIPGAGGTKPGAGTASGKAGAGKSAGAGAAKPRTKVSEVSRHLAWPLRGSITARYGARGKSDHHEGIDIDGETGDPIAAAASGTVAFAGMDGSYGRVVVVDHGGGLMTVYAHASKLLVEEGDEVSPGDEIAEVGRSGNAHGSHLHFEVRKNGRPVDPMPYLRIPPVVTAGVH